MDMEELKSLLMQQGDAFDAFKKANDDAFATERKEREALELKLSKLGIQADRTADPSPERKAVGLLVRTGDDTELKGMMVGSDPDGGYTVLPAFAAAIRTKVRDLSPIAKLARRIQIDRADAWEEPFDLGEVGASWVGETEARPGLTTPTIGLLKVPLHEIYTSQVLTQKLLDTSNYDIGAWVEGRIADKFARAEGVAFVTGNGVAKPRGLLTYPTSTAGDSTRADGTLQYVPTGTSGAFAGSNPGDALVTLVHSLRAPYRANASWLMNAKTAGLVRNFKDSTGRFLWADSLAAGMPDALLGYPVRLDETMPDIAADSYAIAFGDYAQAYTIAEQPGLKLLRDPFSSKPNMILYAYRRVGGGVSEGEAVKLLKFAAS